MVLLLGEKEKQGLDVFSSVIVDLFKIRKRVLGKIDCQKTAYFAKRLGAPIPFDFRWNIFGPYSYELAHNCDYLVIEGLLQYAGEYKLNNRFVGRHVSVLETKTMNHLKKFFGELDDICNKKGYDRVLFIECAASLDFVQSNIKEETRKKENVFSLLDELKPGKKEDFRKMREDAWNLLVLEKLVNL
jgi:uncharacterized protein YwgA